MLETLDLDVRMDRKPYREQMDRLKPDLGLLQRAARAHGMPVVLVFEGWEGAGKGDAMGRIAEILDPRGFKLFTIRQRSEDERMRPFLWRHWSRTPARGEIVVLDRSWYWELASARLGGELDHSTWERAIEEVKTFERQLTDDGTLLLKFWLHIGRREQKRRVKAWAKDPFQRWRVGEGGSGTRYEYERVLEVAEETLATSHTSYAPWVLVESEDDRHRRVKVLRETVDAMRRWLAARGIEPPSPGHPSTETAVPGDPHPDTLPDGATIPPDSPLARVDLSLSLPRKRYRKELAEAQEKLRELELLCYVRRRPVVMVFEGWDAAGKGGAIVRLTERLDPRGYAVHPVAAPRGDEATHHYLWRFWRDLPKDGHFAIFDRSWYGRVLVERVEGLCSEREWRRAYQEINEFERELVHDEVVVLKFWLHISAEEQLRRFRQRERVPRKRHKIVDEDWRNRSRWPAYLEAVDAMLRNTSTAHAPWTVVEAEDKLHARVRVVRTAVDVIEGAVEGRGRPRAGAV